MSSSAAEDANVFRNRENGLTWLGVCGAPRSGTTVLLKILNLSKEIGLFSEYGLEHYIRSIDRVFPDVDYGSAIASGMGLNSALKPYSSVVEEFYGQRTPQELYEERIPSYRAHSDALLRAGYQVVFPEKSLRIVGEKMPLFGQKNNVDWLRHRLCSFRLLCIVRNPLDVINSSIYRRNKADLGFDRWHVSSIEQAATEWISEWNWISSMRTSMRNDIHIIKYEDMAHRTDEVMKGICDFLEINPFTVKPFEPIPESLRFHALTPVEHARVHNWFCKLNQQWNEKPLHILLDEFPSLPALLHVNEPISFSSSGNCLTFIQSGFYEPEDIGSWTKGKVAEFSVNLGINRIPCRMRISFQPYHTCQQIDVLVNGLSVGSHRVVSGSWELQEFVSEFVFEPHSGVGMNVQIVIDSPNAPDAQSADQREIGIFIHKVYFTIG